METLVAPIVNFSILVGILVFKLRAPIRAFVTQRHHSIREEIQTVRHQFQQAQEKYDEFSAKLKAIGAEISVLREQSKQDTSAMKQRIISEGRRISGTIVSDANNSANGLFAELKGQLYFELSSRVLDRAEVILKSRLTGDDRARIRQEFSSQVESIQ